jgi:hypothetical protein
VIIVHRQLRRIPISDTCTAAVAVAVAVAADVVHSQEPLGGQRLCRGSRRRRRRRPLLWRPRLGLSSHHGVCYDWHHTAGVCVTHVSLAHESSSKLGQPTGGGGGGGQGAWREHEAHTPQLLKQLLLVLVILVVLLVLLVLVGLLVARPRRRNHVRLRLCGLRRLRLGQRLGRHVGCGSRRVRAWAGGSRRIPLLMLMQRRHGQRN